jgi:hypothetical protein
MSQASCSARDRPRRKLLSHANKGYQPDGTNLLTNSVRAVIRISAAVPLDPPGKDLTLLASLASSVFSPDSLGCNDTEAHA